MAGFQPSTLLNEGLLCALPVDGSERIRRHTGWKAGG